MRGRSCRSGEEIRTERANEYLYNIIAMALHPASTQSRYGRGSHVITRFQQFLDRTNIPSAQVEAKLRERLKGTAPGRRKMARIRLGRTDPVRRDMVYILWAVREVADNPSVQMEDLFNLNANDPSNWPE